MQGANAHSSFDWWMGNVHHAQNPKDLQPQTYPPQGARWLLHLSKRMVRRMSQI